MSILSWEIFTAYLPPSFCFNAYMVCPFLEKTKNIHLLSQMDISIF